MTSRPGLAYETYPAGQSEEWMMRIGPTEGAPILFLPPLFEEMNRTRAFLAAVMRSLAERGFGCWLPDLPGTGESNLPLLACDWLSWKQAALDAARHLARVAGRQPLVASFRGGALLDHPLPASAVWRFAPAEGASLARDLVRASLLAADELKGAQLDLAGYKLSKSFLSEIQEARFAKPFHLRTVRLASDRGDAELKLEGPALWRRSEPATAPELSTLIASDIAEWHGQCAGC